MRRIPCALCGIDDARPLYHQGAFSDGPVENEVCRRCGLVYVNPQPTAEEYAAYYETGYCKGVHGREDPVLIRAQMKGKERQDLRTWNVILDFFADYLGPGKRVLEIGCGYGQFLDLVRRRTGAAVFGVEPSEISGRFAEREFGLPMRIGPVERFLATPPEKRFDVVIFHHSFEHLPDPVGVLRRLRDFLAPDGHLYLAVPNVMDPRKPLPTFFEYTHPYSYSPHTIRLLLERAGMKIVRFHRRQPRPKLGMELVAAWQEHPEQAVPADAFAAGASARAVVRAVRWHHLVEPLRAASRRAAASVAPRWLKGFMRTRRAPRLDGSRSGKNT